MSTPRTDRLIPPGVHYLQGAQACAEAAITAGCRVYAGYPITPATEIMEHAAHRMPEVGGRFIQMEDEIGSASALLGAAWAGAKAMTATSSPGFSLMQEVISFAIMTETPLVIVDVQRPGPGQGYITTGQEDVMQARWGHHGEGSIIALSPASVQEMFDFTIEAFNLSERWRTPVLLMAEETVAHMRERLVVPPLAEIRIVNRTRPQDLGIPPRELPALRPRRSAAHGCLGGGLCRQPRQPGAPRGRQRHPLQPGGAPRKRLPHPPQDRRPRG